MSFSSVVQKLHESLQPHFFVIQAIQVLIVLFLISFSFFAFSAFLRESILLSG